ncbi:MAG: hypothetical protein PHW82_13180 [Bacteroidales bacterium]|nr:hypothetical protein [Bacteroidales bacterium]
MKNNNQEDMLEKMRGIALQNPDKIQIIETSVDSEIQIEFFETLQRVSDIEEEFNLKSLYSELVCEETAIERKQDILAMFATAGEVESFRLLEDYLKNAADDIKTWAFLACQQGRMLLESRLLEESKIYVASGLGGRGHKLRYVFAFVSLDKTYNEYQKNIIKGEIEYFSKKNEGEIEKIEFVEAYTLCTVLVPLYVNLIELIEKIVEEINQYGGFLNDKVYITNEKLVQIEDLEIIFN